MNRYKIVGNISAGAHGNVFKAVHSPSFNAQVLSTQLKDEKYFAIKRVFLQKVNSVLSILREIKSLQYLSNHPNIISILDIFCQGSTLNLVFPLLPVNLTILIYEYNLTNSQQARYAHMLLEGVSYCHENNIIHRDLKPANLLIDWNGLLKICDFGQARTLDQLDEDDDIEQLSHQVCTRWYRSPELLYGAINYDFSVDIWSVGCILAEMLQKQPLFKGHSDIEQLCLVVKQLGQPPASWAKTMPDYNKLHISFDKEMNDKCKWDYVLAERSKNLVGVDLVKRIIRYERRESAKQLLTHKFMSGLNFDEDNELIKVNMIKQMVGPPKQKKLN